MSIKSIDENIASGHLKPHLRKLLKKAFKQLASHNDKITALRKFEPNAN